MITGIRDATRGEMIDMRLEMMTFADPHEQTHMTIRWNKGGLAFEQISQTGIAESDLIVVNVRSVQIEMIDLHDQNEIDMAETIQTKRSQNIKGETQLQQA